MTNSRVLVAAGLLLLGCGDKGKDKAPVAQAGVLGTPSGPSAPPLAAPPLGLESVAAYNYAYGKGGKDWEKVEELTGKKGDKDWPAIAAACEATLLKDPGHLDAHYVLAEAMSRQGKLDGIAEHLATALAGDWLRWGPKVEADEDLAAFFASPGGARVKELNARLEDGFSQVVRRGVLVVGRRTGYKPPSKPGAQPMSTRAELFAFDGDTQRWVRITQTGWRLAAWTLAPSGDELAYVTFNKVNLGTAVPAPAAGGAVPAAAPAAPANPPVITEARVGVLNLLALDQPVKEAKLKDVGGVILQYDAGDKLLATTVTLTGKWEESEPRTYVIDGQAGEAKATDPAPTDGTRVRATYDFTETERAEVAGVEADWGPANDAAPTFRLTNTQKTITLPRGEAASRASFVWSPSGARVAFGTWSDPCAKAAPARQSSVYVVDAATGKLKHLFKGEGRFDIRWASDDQVVYEDDKGGLRVYDAAQGREVVRHATRGGLALDGIGAISGPICKVSYRPQAAVPEGEGADLDDEGLGEMPPEEPVE